MRALLIALAMLGAVSAQGTSLQIIPTTTLTAETSNNTSAAGTWTTSSNGDLGASNVSKVDHRTLLYPGATTQIYSNIMFWFGPSNHIQVGYNSFNYNQVKKQVDDQLSRGITGTIVDWYGIAHTWDNGATLYLKQYAESLTGYPFKFAIMEDKGALSSCVNTSGCDVTAQLISDLTYILTTYGVSPAYMKVGGRPVIFFFGVEAYAIDWNRVESSLSGNPLFIFENSSGFARFDSSGGFAWVIIDTSNPYDWKQSYLDSFYSQALTYPSEHTFGTSYKGFDDTLASWSLNRIMNQQCGQVWLNTWNEIGTYYSAEKQLEALQIVTWNDYEEGSEIESGIDNCASISASVSGSTLSWALNGNENTVDHYLAFISTDGQNLMPLATISTGIYDLDLSQFGIGPGSYTLYVKAVGKPSIINHMSSAATFEVAAPPAADPPPTVSVTASPASMTIAAGETASYSVTVNSQNLSGAVSLACSGLPSGATCSFTPSLLPAGAKSDTVLTVATTAQTTARQTQFTYLFATLAPFAGVIFWWPRRLRRRWYRLALFVVLAALCGCGGGTGRGSASAGNGSTSSSTASVPAAGSSQATTAAVTPSGTYTINIVASTGTLQNSAPVIVVVR